MGHEDEDVSLQHIAEDCGLSSSRELAEAFSALLRMPLTEIPEEHHIERELIALVPEQIARRYTLIPFKKENENALTLVVANPLDLDAEDTVRALTGLEIHKTVGVEEDILRMINKSYREEAFIDESLQDIVSLEESIELEEDRSGDRVEIDQLKHLANDAPVIRFVNLLLMKSIEDRASDIHFEPAEKYVAVRFRIDGILREVTPPPRSLYPAIATRIKILSELDIAEHRLPQDGRFKFKVHGRIIDVRVSVLPVAHGEKIVLRILDREALLVDMADVGFEPDMLADFKRILQMPNGIILLTGPTGSGKTTTLYSALSFLKNPELNLQTVEDPIEYLVDGVNQTQIRPVIDLDFADCLRSILRQVPDIIMIGEIRDLETAQFIGDFEKLKNSGAPEVAGMVAFVASRTVPVGPSTCIGTVEFNQINLASGRGNFFFAFRADHTHEPLSDKQFDRGGHEVGLYADVSQAAEGGRGVVGVQCAQHQMAGQ